MNKNIKICVFLLYIYMCFFLKFIPEKEKELLQRADFRRVFSVVKSMLCALAGCVFFSFFVSHNVYADSIFVPTREEWRSLFPKTSANTAALNKNNGGIVKGSGVSDTITRRTYRGCSSCLPLPTTDNKVCVVVGGPTSGKPMEDDVVLGLSAKGSFYIDWGDGEAYEVVRPNTNLTFYTHKYPNGTSSTKPSTSVFPQDSETFSGNSQYNGLTYYYSTAAAKICVLKDSTTGYSTTTKTFASDYGDITVPVPAMIFSDYYNGGSSSSGWFVRGVFGSLSALFPILSGTGTDKIPAFAGTFIGNSRSGPDFPLSYNSDITKSMFNGINKTRVGQFAFTFAGNSRAKLNSTTANGVFAGVSGSPAQYLFAGTFADAKLLNNLNNKLFGSLSGAIQKGTFVAALADANGIYGKIPAGLFSGITGAPQADSFSYMFRGISGLGTSSADSTTPNNDYYISPSLFSGLSTSGFTSGSKMHLIFKFTHLPYLCPAGKRKYVTGFEADWNTFSDSLISLAHSAISCEDCPVGTYSGSANDSTAACTKCPKGTYAGSTGRTSCSSCPTAYPNTSATGQTAITACYATVTFNSNGGSSVASQTKNYSSSATSGYKISTLPTSTKTGYTLSGWYQNSGLTGSAITTSTVLSGNKTLYAKWTPISYAIQLNTQGSSISASGWNKIGSTSNYSKSYNIETATFTLPTPAAVTGQVFSGWFTDTNYTTKVTQVTKGTTGNKTYYAKWTPINYTIAYTPNGGQCNGGNPSPNLLSVQPASFTTSSNGITITTTGNGVYTISGTATADTRLYIPINKITIPTSVGNNGTGLTAINNDKAYSDTSVLVQFYNDTVQLGGYQLSSLYRYSSSYGSVLAEKTANRISVFVYSGKTTNLTIMPAIYNDGRTTPGNFTASYVYGETHNCKPAVYTIKNNTITLPTPTKAGYAFGGWYTNSNFSGSAVTTIASGSTGDKQYHAKWTPNTYTVTYNCGDGTGTAPTAGTATYDANFTPESNSCTAPTGYSFDGWTVSNTGTPAVVKSAGAPFKWTYTENKTFTAKWKANTYTVTYNCGDGTGTAPTAGTATYDTDFTPATSECTVPVGYSFDGWTVSGTTSDVKSAGVSFKWKYAENKTFTAKWTPNTYTVTYNCGDGTGTAPTAGTATYDANFTPESNSCTAPTGYSFDGWIVSNTGAPAVVKSAGAPFKWTYTENKTFTAKWSPNTINLTWDKNGHGGTPTGGSVSCIYGSTFNISDALEETGWTFGGWTIGDHTINTNCNVDNLGVSDNNSTATIKAKWAPNTINLVWDAGAHGTSPSPTTCEYGSTFNMKPKLIELGWLFKEWVIDDNEPGFAAGALVACDEGILGVSDDGASVIIKATWDYAPYTIKYYTNGGSMVGGVPEFASYNAQCIQSGACATLPTAEKTGYNFDGWCMYGTEQTLPATCVEPITALASGTTGDKYMYAKWGPNTINLTWDKNGHGETPTGGSVSCIYGSTFNISDALEETGWAFGGWTIGDHTINTNCNVDNLGVSDNNSTATITAQWTPNTINLKWNNGGHGGDAPTTPGSCTYDLSFDTPEALSETGWIFKGWGINNKTFGAEKTVECDVANLNQSANNSTATITAQWEAEKYTITYHANGGTMAGIEPMPEENNVYVQQYTVESSSIALTEPTRDGYLFGGWYENENFAGDPLLWPIEPGSTEGKYHRSIDLYARWKVHCGSGTYLPANSEVCEDCEEGYYCGAGYHFIKDSKDQGRESCSERTEDGFIHSALGENSVHGCFAELTLYGNGGKTSDNAESFEFKAHNNGTEGRLACLQYQAKQRQILGDDTFSYPVCVSPYVKTKFVYALHPDVIDNPTPFTRLGYDFLGWCPSSEPCENKVLATTELKGDKQLYAQWELTNYPITYYDVLVYDDGHKEITQRSVPDDNPATYTIESSFNFIKPSKPQVDKDLGWVFDSWYADEDLSNSVDGISAGQTEPKTYYAKWTPKIGYVNFICDPTTIKEKHGQVGLYIDVETCNSGENMGWSCSGYPEFNDSHSQIRIPDGVTDCRPGYMITYKGDGIQNNTMIDRDPPVRLVPDTYTSDLEVVFPSKNFMNSFKLRPGYSFTGWFYNHNPETNTFSNKTTGLPRGSSGHKTVWAQWSPNPYTVTYDCDSTTEGSITPIPENVTYDEQFTTAENVCVKTGYTFAGWMVSGTDDVKSENEAFQWKYDEDKTFTAKWNPIIYEVAFDGNSATGGSMDNQQFVYDTEQPLATNAFTKDDYKFVGWCDDWDVAEETCAGTMYDDEQVVSNLTSENGTTIKLYAMWALQDYTITYNVLKDEDSGTWRVESDLTPATYTIYSADALPDSINATRPGYGFVGWCDEDSYANENCSIVNMADLTGSSVRTDMDLYAKWEIINYPITYYVYYFDNAAWRSDEVFADEYNTYNVEDYEKALPTPSALTGEVFLGWCTVSPDEDPGCEPITIFTPTADSLGGLKLYAKWSYDITYVLNGGTGVLEPETYDYGVGLDVLPEPTRDDGYTFVGWYKDADLSGNKVESIPVDGEWGPITLYAKWEFSCDGKWLHVGSGENDKMCLSGNRPDGKVLGIMVDNVPYYVRLSERGDNSKTISNNSNTKLHVQIGETVYNAHDASVE